MEYDTSGLPLNYLNFTMTVQLVQAGAARSISKDYERKPALAEAMIYIAMIRLMVRRLA